MTYPSAQRIPDVGKDRETYVIVLLFRVKYVITTLPRGYLFRDSRVEGEILSECLIWELYFKRQLYIKKGMITCLKITMNEL